jgi:uncharacterized protein (DUF1684 family)
MKEMDWRIQITIPCSLFVLLLISSCGEKQRQLSLSSQDSVAIVQDNLAHRAEVDDFMRNSPDSPFSKDSTIQYHGINWFPINPYFKGRSVLHRYENPETVSVYGTKGEERKNLRYGYFELNVPDGSGKTKSIRINAYKFTPYDKKRYELYKNNLSLWFTDKTTGKATYYVGRYIELGEENPDPDYIYTIDLNKAFNPYCAYSDNYSCAIPRKEDHLDIVLRVGEMKYHDSSTNLH